MDALGFDSCITQLEAQGPSRTCNESKEDEDEGLGMGQARFGMGLRDGVGGNAIPPPHLRAVTCSGYGVGPYGARRDAAPELREEESLLYNYLYTSTVLN